MSPFERFITFLRWGSRNAVCSHQARKYAKQAAEYAYRADWEAKHYHGIFPGNWPALAGIYERAANRCMRLRRVCTLSKASKRRFYRNS